MPRPPIVRYAEGRALIDRKTLARLSGRSERTIREHCPVVRRDGIRPLYDAQQCAVILAAVPQRKRCAQLTTVG